MEGTLTHSHTKTRVHNDQISRTYRVEGAFSHTHTYSQSLTRAVQGRLTHSRLLSLSYAYRVEGTLNLTHSHTKSGGHTHSQPLPFSPTNTQASVYPFSLLLRHMRIELDCLCIHVICKPFIVHDNGTAKHTGGQTHSPSVYVI